MIFRTNKGTLIEINRLLFVNDEDYYKFIIANVFNN